MSEWRPVVGYEGLYAVSDGGQIISLPRLLASANRWGRFVKTWPEKILIQATCQGNGYRFVSLCKGGVIKNKTVHVVVCEAFHGPRPVGFQCAHLDGVKENNRADNLSWVTAKENAFHRRAHGTANRGDNAHQAILSEKDIPQIRARYGAGETCRVIAKDFGVHPSTIHKACRGKNWAGVA
jgi:hypothetical protein